MTNTTATLSLDQLKELISTHVHKMETGETRLTCKCEWTDLGNGKKIRGMESPECPIHTKEGLILDFITRASLVLEDKQPSGRMVYVVPQRTDPDGESL